MTTHEKNELDQLIERARTIKMSDAEDAEQRKSFAYGNTAFENPIITREMVEEEARKLGY